MPLLEAEQKIKVQMEDFQHRYQRCIQRCQDVAVEKLSATPSDAERKNAEVSHNPSLSTASHRFPDVNPIQWNGMQFGVDKRLTLCVS